MFLINLNAEIVACILSFRKSRHKPNLESTSKYGFPPDLGGKKWRRFEHAHASYPGLFFRPPGFSPYVGREKKGSSGTGLIHSQREIKEILDPENTLFPLNQSIKAHRRTLVPSFAVKNRQENLATLTISSHNVTISTREPKTRAWISADIWRQDGAIWSKNRKIVPYHGSASGPRGSRSLRWMVPVFRFFEYVNFERKEQKVNSTS